MANLDEGLCIAQFLGGSPENYIDKVIFRTVTLKAWGQDFDREDVIQNARLALLKIFREGKYQTGALTTFVQRIAEFECINEMRRHYRQKKHHEAFTEEALETPDPQGDPMAATLEREEKDKAVRILISLDKPCRKLLHLKFFNGLPYKEIAGQLRMTEVNVRVSIFRCLKKSKEIAVRMEKVENSAFDPKAKTGRERS